MALGQRIIGSLKNAFSYVVHRESAADHARKPAVVADILAASLPLGDDSAEYASRLRNVLSQTSTKTLDVLKAKQVAVMLDTRLDTAKENAVKVEGVYYPGPLATATGGIVTLYDPLPQTGFFAEPAWHGPLMLESFRKQLDGDLPQVPLYANVHIEAAVGEGGAIMQTTRAEWGATTIAAPKPKAPPLKP